LKFTSNCDILYLDKHETAFVGGDEVKKKKDWYEKDWFEPKPNYNLIPLVLHAWMSCAISILALIVVIVK